MKNYVLILIGVIIALVVVGGAIAYISMHDDPSDNNNTTIKFRIPNNKCNK